MTHHQSSCAQFDEMLAGYLEGSLTASQHADAELHLASCSSCRALVADLEHITTSASTLSGIAPSRDLWPGIEARIATPVTTLRSRSVSRRLFSFAVAASATVAVALATLKLQGPTPPVVAVDTVDPASAAVRAARQDAPTTYATEMFQLERAFAERAGSLDPETRAIVERSLLTIDSAISAARSALLTDSGSGLLHRQLDLTLERKLGVLRTVALLPIT